MRLRARGRRRLLLVAAALLATSVAACSNDDVSGEATGTDATTAVSPTAPDPGATTSTSGVAPTSAPDAAGSTSITVPAATTPAGEGVLPAPTPAALVWADCDGGFECATLTVPLDHTQPAAAQVQLALVRKPATGGSRLGSVVLNPGGPGGSGVQFLRSAAGAFRDLNRQLDLVSFDPRGVGASTPAVRCHDDLDDTTDVLGPGGLTEERLSARIGDDKRRCSTIEPALLAHVGTNAAARDLEWLRVALGEPKLTYLGFSYGTRLGSVYAELFPSSVGALALDGADVPTQALSRSVGEQFIGFEEAFHHFADWCDDPARGACPTGDHGGAEATFRAVERQLREAGPLETRLGSRRLTVGELYLGVIAALYSDANWARLGSALAEVASTADGTALQQFVDNLLDRHADGRYANTIDANVAVNCADDPERPTFADALARGRELSRNLPLLGPLAETAFMDCVGWAAPAEPVALPSGKGVLAPVLVIGTTGDPATPYPWAAQLARALVSARLLTYRGEGHTAYFASSCVRAAVDTYLTTLVLPEGGDC